MNRVGLELLLLLLPTFSRAQGDMPMSARSSAKVVASTGKRRSISLRTSHGIVSAEFHELRVGVNRSDGKSEPGSIFAVYDPATKLFWWTYQLGHVFQKSASARMDDFLSGYGLFLANNKIVGAYMSGFYQIYIREGAERHSTVDEGLGGAVKSVETGLSANQLLSLFYDKQIDTLPFLGRQFFESGTLSAIGAPMPNIDDLNWDGSRWRVRFTSPNKAKNANDPARKDVAIFFLDANYNVVRVTVNDTTVYPK